MRALVQSWFFNARLRNLVKYLLLGIRINPILWLLVMNGYADNRIFGKSMIRESDSFDDVV